MCNWVPTFLSDLTNFVRVSSSHFGTSLLFYSNSTGITGSCMKKHFTENEPHMVLWHD